MIDYSVGARGPVAGGARLVTALGGVPAVYGGIYREDRQDAPSKQARGANDWLGSIYTATRSRGAAAQPIMIEVCLGEFDGGVEVGRG